MADWGDAFSEIGKDLSSAGEAVHNWWDAFESKPSTTVPLPPATPATPAQERRFKGKTPDPKGFPVPSRADLQRQQALDNNDETGHFGDVISEAARSAIPGVVGFLGDLADTPVAAFERATGIGHPKPTLPGSGRVSRKISQLWDAFTQPDNAPVPTSKAEERASAVTQGVVSSLPFIGEAPAKVLLSGVTGGGGSQAAHEAFPNSDIAPFIGGIVGGGAPFVMPVRGRVTSGFGEREAPIAGASTYHQGIDIAVPSGTPVKAPEAGVISRIGADRKAGRWVEIDHGDGLKTKYLHLGEIHGKVGDEVSPGDVFAKSGATGNVTGPHLHWAAFKDGKAIDPRTLARDPARPPAPPMDPAEISSAWVIPKPVSKQRHIHS
jgi:murein DD-endopeptidase MepM/ murein hydrolase activator NlpD